MCVCVIVDAIVCLFACFRVCLFWSIAGFIIAIFACLVAHLFARVFVYLDRCQCFLCVRVFV